MADLGVQLPSRIRIASTPEPIQSAPFCSVPWLISMASLIVAYFFIRTPIDPLLQAFALGSIVAGPIAFVTTHFTANQITAGNRQRLLPVAVGALLLTGVVSALVGALFFSFVAQGDLLQKSAAIVLQIYVAMNFVALGFPAVFRKVRGPAFVLIVGFGISFAAGKMGASLLHTTGMLVGFAIGQIVLFGFLILLIRYEFGKGDGSLASAEIMRQLKKQQPLAWCGFALAVGIWVDKLLPFPIAPDWKMTSLALLSALPGIAFFFLHLRTDFTPALRNFSDALRNGETLANIRTVKAGLVRAFQSGFAQLIGVQAVITLILVYYSTTIAKMFHFDFPESPLFRVALVGSFLLVIFIAMLSLLLYLNDTKGAAIAAGALALITTGLTITTLFVLPVWNGFGFVIASGVALLIAVFRVNARLSRLEFSAIGGGEES